MNNSIIAKELRIVLSAVGRMATDNTPDSLEHTDDKTVFVDSHYHISGAGRRKSAGITNVHGRKGLVPEHKPDNKPFEQKIAQHRGYEVNRKGRYSVKPQKPKAGNQPYSRKQNRGNNAVGYKIRNPYFPYLSSHNLALMACRNAICLREYLIKL